MWFEYKLFLLKPSFARFIVMFSLWRKIVAIELLGSLQSSEITFAALFVCNVKFITFISLSSLDKFFFFSCQGMGEPLNNYRALVEAIQVMTGPPFQLSPKRITVSTVSCLKTYCDKFYSVFVLASYFVSVTWQIADSVQVHYDRFHLSEILSSFFLIFNF